jgi:hypothetical protein
LPTSGDSQEEASDKGEQSQRGECQGREGCSDCKTYINKKESSTRIACIRRVHQAIKKRLGGCARTPGPPMEQKLRYPQPHDPSTWPSPRTVWKHFHWYFPNSWWDDSAPVPPPVIQLPASADAIARFRIRRGPVGFMNPPLSPGTEEFWARRWENEHS